MRLNLKENWMPLAFFGVDLIAMVAVSLSVDKEDLVFVIPGAVLFLGIQFFFVRIHLTVDNEVAAARASVEAERLAFLEKLGAAAAADSAPDPEPTGATARATITSIEPTGTTINDQPECSIGLYCEPGTGTPFTALATRVVLVTDIPRYQPGAIVTVSYDPSNPARVAIRALGEVIDEAEGRQLLDRVNQLVQEFRQPGVGVAAPAIVTAFLRTGIHVNGPHPLARLEVKVLPPGGEPFDARLAGVFHAEALHKYQAGKTVQVRYDPRDLARISIDPLQHETETSGPSGA